MSDTSWKIDDADDMFGAVLATDLFAEARAGVFPAPGPETVTGTAGRDVIRTGGGADSIAGRGGNDRLFGGAGNDSIAGQAGKDQVYGGGGGDNLNGGGRNDKVIGGNGNDIMAGGAGRDALFGGRGNDVLSDNKGNNKLFGGDGNDILSGRGTLAGGAGDDTLTSSNEANSDTFDFRTPDDDTNGLDTVVNYSYDRTGALSAGRDTILLDNEVQANFEYVQSIASIVMTMTRTGTEIGSVRFADLAANDLTQTELNFIIQGLVDDILRM